jgi:hypothetical protein
MATHHYNAAREGWDKMFSRMNEDEIIEWQHLFDKHKNHVLASMTKVANARLAYLQGIMRIK